MRRNGFSMVELMVAVAIIAILAGIAVPNLSLMMANQRVKTAANDLYTSFLRVRNESITRNKSIYVGPLTGLDWTNGWNIVDPAVTQVIETHGPLTSVVITAAGVDVATGRVTVNNVGRVVNTVKFDFSSANTPLKRCVTIEIIGRPKVKSCACASTC